MIIDGLFSFLASALHWAATLLPDWTVSGEFLQGFGSVLGNLAALNYYLPIGELFTAVLGVFYVLPIFLGTTVTLWIIALIRGGSARA